MKTAKTGTAPPVPEQVKDVLVWLELHATKATRDGLARYGLPAERAFGVTMADMKALGKGRLAAVENPTARWVGKDALTELTSAAVGARLKVKRSAAG